MMTEIRQILVPVDFSEPAQLALDYAGNVASKLGGTLDLLHVWEMPSFVPPVAMAIEGMSLADWARKNAQESLDAFVREATSRGVTVRAAHSMPGRAASTIVEFAETEGFDLIVLGTHGRTGLSRMLLGSVAENVVRHAACPVLTVRSRPSTPK
jgi:nucleotide-binding universal stress UspA family protein